jgi:hypothetical protein
VDTFVEPFYKEELAEKVCCACRVKTSVGAVQKARPWYEVLEIPRTSSKMLRRFAWKTKVLRAHPDQGGSREAWDELERAKREAGIEEAAS